MLEFKKYIRKILIKPAYLFIGTFIVIILTYFIFLGEEKSIELLTKEYELILVFIPLIAIAMFFRIKLRKYQIIDYTKNSAIGFKQTVLIFLVFQVIDYIYEDGLIGMISQWFLYWVMGLIALFIIKNINYYKNYKYIKAQS
jgi:hypothetical protein